jgi:hypothetical protein
MLSIVYGNPRSGTNLLRNLLNQHKEIQIDREVFNKRVCKELGTTSEEWFSDIIGREVSGERSVNGFKVLGYQYFGNGGLEALRGVEHKSIFIMREDMFEHIVSYACAEREDKWYNEDYKDEPIRVEGIHMKNMLNRRKQLIDLLKRKIGRGKPVYFLTYEELVGDSSNKLREIFEFLGVDSIELSLVDATCKKQFSKKYEDYVINYTEVRKFVARNDPDLYLRKLKRVVRC